MQKYHARDLFDSPTPHHYTFARHGWTPVYLASEVDEELRRHANERSRKDARFAELERSLSAARGEANFHRERTVFLESKVAELEASLEVACHRRSELEAALREAIEDIESWGSYASDYFQNKHDLAGCIGRHRKVLGL